MQLVNRVGNVYGWLIICVNSMSGGSILSMVGLYL